MKTLTLQQAADFLKMHPEVLRLKATKGLIPGAKPSKRWCFRLDDLAEYLRSLYPSVAKASQGVIEIERSNKWRSTKEEIRGGLISASKANAYSEALGGRTK
jgi:hypothetical protein